MTRYGPMFGPDVTFLGVPPCTLEDGRSAVEVVLAIYDQQSRVTREPNFVKRPETYRGDETSHPALRR